MIKYKAISIATAIALASVGTSYAMKTVSFDNQSLSQLNNFQIQANQSSKNFALTSDNENTLVPVSTSTMASKEFTRLQQQYKGIEVVGKTVVIESNANANSFLEQTSSTVSGHLAENIDINTQAQVTSNQVMDLARNLFTKGYPGYQITEEGNNKPYTKLQIVTNGSNKAQLVYLVTINGHKLSAQPVAMHYYFDANTAKLLSAWDNIQNYDDTGVGGNEKVGKYYYGENGMPTLDVAKNGSTCTMNNERVRAVNMNHKTSDNITSAFTYSCGLDRGDSIYGSYSALDDAYYFGDIIIDMYHDWYKITALKNKDGTPMQLVMRVHYGNDYANAFWNSKNMTFGDGDPNSKEKIKFYPLVSLDVAGHEVSHGFTQQHSNLIYENESGSLNEAYSDMAGQATRAYLLSQNAQDYNEFYPEDPQGKIGWGLGETITRGAGQSLRYMNQPSDDGSSADCYDKSLALQSGSSCKITYDDVVTAAKKYPWWSGKRQGYIVHKGSGVFNKAFYLLSTKWYQEKEAQGDKTAFVDGVEEAFRVMVLANIKYWNQSTGFNEAACGVVKSARDLNYSITDVINAFDQVGVETSSCKI
ncbi:M4 family metallopeptidase [Thiotrichales bacterium 19S3-7]|nr:M4 family metallopeptidase [Thiotrichales bacterium 19S3-7]MCF6802844.1 M4 family metallopeptidase [Thiotrichales bacterium 19S3-11]